MNPKASSLFHFTKSLDVLRSILKNGIRPKYCLEDIRWLGESGHDFLAYPMCCFCDIPLSRASEHTSFYGNYGIGLSRDWGLKNSLNPVLYAPSQGKTADAIRFFGETMKEFNLTDHEDNYRLHTISLLQMVKPLSGEMFINNEFVSKEFYQENEWRYIFPDEASLLFHKDYEEMKEQRNKEVENKYLKFTPSDIRYIFVHDDNEIPLIVDFINKEMGHYPLNDLKILQSRITSLETLKTDM